MEDDTSVIYGLEFQGRALCAQLAETDSIRFLVGTQSLRSENQVHQICFDEDNNCINKNVFIHADGDIWHISSSPHNRDILATCYNCTSESKCEMKASIFKIPPEIELDSSSNSTIGEDVSASSAPSLKQACNLYDASYGDTRSVIWHPFNEDQVITLANGNILRWSLSNGGKSLIDAHISSTATLEGKGNPRFTAARWNPHHNGNSIATAHDSHVFGWDLRSPGASPIYKLQNAHAQLVRNMDYNPNKQYCLATCGDDCYTRFWDVRRCDAPVHCISVHSHWVWSVRFNQFHDQLILTSSSDSRVVLTNAASISSEPYGNLSVEDEPKVDLNDTTHSEESNKLEVDTYNKKTIPDGTIASYEEHEDSVYAVEWSSTDPWLFASLSYDGRLVINRVPRQTKYSILL